MRGFLASRFSLTFKLSRLGASGDPAICLSCLMGISAHHRQRQRASTHTWKKCRPITGGTSRGVEQVKTLKKLSWFFTAGTAAQLFAVGVVAVKLALEPDPSASHELLHKGDPVVSIVAVMNIIFAYGGQVGPLPAICNRELYVFFYKYNHLCCTSHIYSDISPFCTSLRGIRPPFSDVAFWHVSNFERNFNANIKAHSNHHRHHMTFSPQSLKLVPHFWDE